MKRIILVIITLIYTLNVFGQDIITYSDSIEVRVEIIEVKHNNTHYKLFDSPNDSVYIVSKDKLIKLEYENGEIEIFNNKKSIIDRFVVNSNPRIERPLSISIRSGLQTLFAFGVSVDMFIIPQINIEFNMFTGYQVLDNVKYYGGGLNYHPWGGKMLSVSPYIGVLYGQAEGETWMSGKEIKFNSLYYPVGINFIHKKGYNISADIGIFHTIGSTTNANVFPNLGNSKNWI